MVEAFFTILLFCVCCVVMAKFLAWCIAARTIRYGDWSSEEKRLRLRAIVQQVREERGDYLAHSKVYRSVPKSGSKKGNRVGTAPRRAVQRKG